MLCRSGSDKRIASDSLYDDQRRFGFRVVRGGRFPAYSSRAGSLETCGFKQTFWSLLGLWPKVTRAWGRGTLSCRCWKKWGRRRQKPEKSDPRSEARNIPFAAGGINRKIGGAGPRRFPISPAWPRKTRSAVRGSPDRRYRPPTEAGGGTPP